MSPLSNSSNNNNNNSNHINTSTLSSGSTNTISSSAFKPLISENHRQLNMLTSSSATMSSVGDHYSNDLTSPYGGAYHHHHHHHLNSQLSTQDYLNAHHHQAPLPPPLGVYKSEHDDMQGYSFARPVKLYDHVAPSVATMDNGNTLSTSSSAALLTANGPTNGNGATNGYTGNLNGFRSSDAPSPGASIIDLSTSSVTSLRSGAGGNASTGFSNGSYYDGQRYDRSPQSASSPHYSSPQMLSPQGQSLDLSVGRTKWVYFVVHSFISNTRIPERLFDGYARASSVYNFHLNITVSNSLNYHDSRFIQTKFIAKFLQQEPVRAATNAMPNPIFRYQTKPFVTKLRCKRQLLCDFCNNFYLRPVHIALHKGECVASVCPSICETWKHQIRTLNAILVPFSPTIEHFTLANAKHKHTNTYQTNGLNAWLVRSTR